MSYTNLIDQLLEEQRCLTPAAAFARNADGHALAGFYRDLIPLSKPGQGEQYGFEVDLDKCTGCKACVSACHSLNGLDEEETWREVGVLVGGTKAHPHSQTVTSACHHCAEPGCLEGCPVLAYEKDAETGIVRHLDDQCIGCSYCILKCPYEVPKYSKNLGIVRKCDMCHGRLAAGEAPACVQACPTSAIAIRVVRIDDARRQAANNIFLPDSPDPGLTIPTTVYKGRKPFSERSLAANHFAPKVQHAHAPLVFMLVLTQAAAGFFLASAFGPTVPFAPAAGAILLLAGLAASVLHLGQPLKAWRAFLGWRTSWLSREIIAFGAFAGFAIPGALLATIPGTWLPIPPGWLPVLIQAFLLAASALGVIAVVCSAFVYHDTHRLVWRGPLSFVRFFLTTALFAALAAGLPQVLAGVLIAKLTAEVLLAVQGALVRSRLNDLNRSARLLRRPLRGWLGLRIALGLATLACLAGPWLLVLGLLLAGEFLERALFFLAGVSLRMPGQAS
jgi:Fe-S-cluster-containing dehydrogenase component/DMSO reductase anchor subunit